MVLEKVKTILSEQFTVEEDAINSETDLINDLKADSLDVIDLLSTIESEFELEIDDDEIDKIKTVGDIVNFIEKLQN